MPAIVRKASKNKNKNGNKRELRETRQLQESVCLYLEACKRGGPTGTE